MAVTTILDLPVAISIDGQEYLPIVVGLGDNATTKRVQIDTLLNWIVPPSGQVANRALSNLASVAINTTLLPGLNDGAALGSGTLSFSDLFLASGGVINWAAGNVTITHSNNLLTLNAPLTITQSIGSSTPSLRAINAIDNASVVSFVVQGARATPTNSDTVAFSFVLNDSGGAATEFGRISCHGTAVTDGAETGDIRFQTASSGVLTSRCIIRHTGFYPQSNDGLPLGISGTAWSDLFLASGGVINWSAGDVTITHSSGLLTTTGRLAVQNGTAAGSFSLGADVGASTLTNAARKIGRMTTPGYNTADLPLAVLSGDADAASSSVTLGGIAGSSSVAAATVINFITASVPNTAGGTVRVSIDSSGHLRPFTNDGSQLGISGTAWSDLFLASGGVINWNAGDVTLTHSSGLLTLAGLLTVTYGASAGTGAGRFINTTDASSVISFRIEGDRATPTNNDQVSMSFALSDSTGTQTEFSRISCVATTVTDTSETGDIRFSTTSAGTLTSRVILRHTGLYPTTDDSMPLGLTTNNWSDLFLASGGVINFNNGNLTMTHSAGALAITGVTTVASATATPAAGSTSARLLFGTTPGFGIYYGSGAPTVSAAQGSLYLRSDGSTTATRLYVNTNGTTGWTNFTSAT